MARLNEEFQLTFHEVDSSIHIGFGEDEALLYIDDMKEIAPIPIEFEESTSRIPVNIAEHYDSPYAGVTNGIKTKITNIQFTTKSLT